MNKAFIYFIVIGISIGSCSKEKNSTDKNTETSDLETGWEVPISKLILSNGSHDFIHSIDNPVFQNFNSNDLDLNETLFVYRFENIVKVYPQNILEKHEIVNDSIGDHHFAITFCPRTGSALVWDREINGIVTEFGVSGHLYNENLIPYDRNSLSYWSQMSLRGIKGSGVNQVLESRQLISTKPTTVALAFPNASVLIDPTKVTKNSKQTNLIQSKRFSSTNQQQILGKDYLGIINRGFAKPDKVLLFDVDFITNSIELHTFNYGNSKLIVVRSSEYKFNVVFLNKTGDPNIQFYAIQDNLPTIFADSKGNNYDLSGLIISGPLLGNRISSPISYSAHSFAWDLFFENEKDYFDPLSN